MSEMPVAVSQRHAVSFDQQCKDSSVLTDTLKIFTFGFEMLAS